MKILELSQKAGVPLPTIKFYIREGLLPPGERTSRNQAEYGQGHLERLALIKALQNDAGLGLDTIARALSAAERAKPQDSIVAAIDALERPARSPVDETAEPFKHARKCLLAIARERGWELDERDVSVRDAARALTAIKRAIPDAPPGVLSRYADAVEILAEHEIPENWAPEDSPEAALRYALLGTVLFEPLILAMRRMAHVARTRKIVAARTKAHRPKEAKTLTKRKR